MKQASIKAVPEEGLYWNCAGIKDSSADSANLSAARSRHSR